MTDPISNERLAEMLAEVEIEFDNALSDAEADQNPHLAVDPVGEFDLVELRSILTELQSRRQSPAGVEPFGYWCECKGAEPAFLRKPAYIPPSDALHTTTPLYASPPQAVTITDEMVDHLVEFVTDVGRYSPKIVPMGANPPLFDGMQDDSDGAWLNRIGAAKRIRSFFTAALSGKARNGREVE